MWVMTRVFTSCNVFEHDKFCNALRTVFTISNVLTGCKVT